MITCPRVSIGYYAPIKPFLDKPMEQDDMLNIDDVLGQKYLNTRLRRSIKINAENGTAALEIMSRFAADPHWLIYLPPTMSPCETSRLTEYLEYPTEAFDYYKTRGVGRVVCEQKHMGSRAVITLCKDADAAAKRFGVNDGTFGIIYTRRGRHFFADADTETAILTRLQSVLTASGFWDDFSTEWVCLDNGAYALVGEGAEAAGRAVCTRRTRGAQRSCTGGRCH